MKKTSLLILLVLLIAGCSNSHDNSRNVKNTGNESFGLTQTAEDYRISSKSLEELVSKGLKNRLQKNYQTKEIILDYPYYEGNSIFATFYVEDKDEVQLGLFYAERIENSYELEFIDINPIENKLPFSVIGASGLMVNGKRNFRATYGYLNDLSINEIRIKYSNNITNSVHLGGKKTFLDVVTGNKVKEEKIEGRDANDKVIYDYIY